jgi:hypothetical protein
MNLYNHIGKFKPSILKYPTGKYGIVGTCPAEIFGKIFKNEEEAKNELEKYINKGE